MENSLPFGQWLKRRRQGLGFTQRTLGEQAGYSHESIRKVEAGVARPSRQMAERLAGALRVAPADWASFVAFARDELDDDFRLSPQTAEFVVPAVPRHNLPTALTRFFGRESEITQLNALLAEQRLVTITGPAGVGKSRLALRVAGAALPGYAAGAWPAELAPVTDPALVLEAVALALGVRPVFRRTLLETLSHFLHTRRLLLVLDNCEHVLDACAWLAEALLSACPRLTLLCTSRQALGVSGEAVFPLPALPLPAAGQPLSPEDVADSPALRLFADRARLVRPEYQITAENADWLARVCQRLDGLPLAIEMAASRMNQLSAEQLAGRLDDAFGVLTNTSRAASPRQQTMRATLDWSYNLLVEPERLLLRRLAVFAGGCTLEAAEVVCAGDGLEAGRVLDTLSALVTKSMVIVDQRPGDAPRYSLLDMVRQYVQLAQPAPDAHQRLSQRHFDYFLRFARLHGVELWYKNRMVWLAKFDAEHSNLLAALAWGYAHAPDPAAGPSLTLALHSYWHQHALEEAWYWFQKGTARCGADASLPAWLKAQMFTCGSAHRLGYDPDATLELARQGLALSRALAPVNREILVQALVLFIENGTSRYMDHKSQALRDETAAALDELHELVQQLGPETGVDARYYRARWAGQRAEADLRHGAYAAAQAAALECVQLFAACCHEEHLIWPYQVLGEIALASGAAGRARDYFLQALRLAQQDDHIFCGDILAALYVTALRLNDPAQALGYCQDYIKLAYAKDTPVNVAELLEMMARIYAQAGHAQTAARFSAAAEALSQKVGRALSAEPAPATPYGDWTTRYANVSLEALVPDWPARPDAAAIQEAWQAGRALSYEQAVTEALAASLAISPENKVSGRSEASA